MKHNPVLIRFMHTCLHYEDIVQTWGITQIQVSDNMISFEVSGFNYTGEIIITLCNDDKTLVLNSSTEYIGSAKTAMETIKLLDLYIESNESKYLSLFNALTKQKFSEEYFYTRRINKKTMFINNSR